MQQVDYGLLSDEETVENSVTISFEPGSIYLLAEKVFNQSTGAHRGIAVSVIRTPEESKYGTEACVATSLVSNDTMGSSRRRTFNDDSTMTLQQVNGTYGIRYALHKIL